MWLSPSTSSIEARTSRARYPTQPRPMATDGRTRWLSWSPRSPGSPAPMAGNQRSDTAKTRRRSRATTNDGTVMNPTERTPESRSASEFR